jgi:hypothetical protein
MSPIRILCIPLLAVAVSACGGKPPGEGAAAVASSATAPAAQDQLADLLMPAPTVAVSSITALKQSAQPGQEVVLRGRIGGRAEPFVAGRAAMVVADDEALAACDTNPDDACTTPWDFCCEPQAEIAKGIAVVQVVGEDGKPKPVDLKGLVGIGPGTVVPVSCTVADGSADGNLIVNATGIHPQTAATPAAAAGAGHDHDHDHDHDHSHQH